jgi:hypothetical protein
MNKLIAKCGLDCKKCEARIATINSDNGLKKEVAKKWSAGNNVEITPEMINCVGCNLDGAKTIFCDKLCPIKQCASKKNFQTCASCSEMETCDLLKMVTSNSKGALENLKKLINVL